MFVFLVLELLSLLIFLLLFAGNRRSVLLIRSRLLQELELWCRMLRLIFFLRHFRMLTFLALFLFLLLLRFLTTLSLLQIEHLLISCRSFFFHWLLSLGLGLIDFLNFCLCVLLSIGGYV